MSKLPIAAALVALTSAGLAFAGTADAAAPPPPYCPVGYEPPPGAHCVSQTQKPPSTSWGSQVGTGPAAGY
jgi:hypothetical protein